MKKYISFVIMALVAVLMPVVLASPASANTWGCTYKDDRNDVTFNGNALGNPPRDVFVQFTVNYKYCVPSDPDLYAFVKPSVTINTINIEGTSISCNNANWFEAVRFNWYFWHPYRGTNFNPGAIRVYCDESTISTKSQHYDEQTTPRFYFGPGNGTDRQPRWKVNVELELNNYPNKSASHSQDFNPSS